MNVIVSFHLGIQCLYMEIKTNYYLESRKIIDSLNNRDTKPTILLHACCGPCAIYPLIDLCPYFDVTLMYNNSNIYPKDEYDRRLEELRKVLDYVKHDYGYGVKLIVTPYDNETYNIDLEPFKDMPEGRERCFICYEKRLKEGYDYAEEHGFDYYSSVMSISRFKNAQKLNEIGRRLEALHAHTKYFYSDFKKNDGQLIALKLKNYYNLYQQTYCGCKYTYEKAKKEN